MSHHRTRDLPAAGPPVPLDLAREFLEALRAEYLRGEAQAVGRLYERRQVPGDVTGLLDALEDQVRDAPNRQAAIAHLAHQWGLADAAGPRASRQAPSAPVPFELARDFIDALSAEYIRAEPEAVGRLYDRKGVPKHLQGILDPFEDRVRDAPDRHREITQLAASWGVPFQAPHPAASAFPPPYAVQPGMPPPYPNGGPAPPPPGAFAFAPQPAGPRRPRRRKALLVGINYFGQRAELAGCINDTHNLKQLLVQTYGWDPGCIVQLTDDNPNAMPTKANIERHLMWLLEDAQPGDAFFLHFSCHGAQEEDPNGFEEDGMHETIVPVDFQRAGMITDDHLHDLVVKPLPEGARVTVVMDCCHSGTGMDLPYMYTGRGWREETNPFHTRGDVQLFSGCADDDTSADASTAYGMAGGAMTTAFCDCLRANPCPTYPDLMAQLHTLMHRRGFSQRPQLTSTQAFLFNRPFHLDDAMPNTNAVLGRIFRKRFPPRPRKLSGPLSEMLGLMAGVGGALLAMEAATVLFS